MSTPPTQHQHQQVLLLRKEQFINPLFDASVPSVEAHARTRRLVPQTHPVAWLQIWRSAYNSFLPGASRQVSRADCLAKALQAQNDTIHKLQQNDNGFLAMLRLKAENLETQLAQNTGGEEAKLVQNVGKRMSFKEAAGHKLTLKKQEKALLYRISAMETQMDLLEAKERESSKRDGNAALDDLAAHRTRHIDGAANFCNLPSPELDDLLLEFDVLCRLEAGDRLSHKDGALSLDSSDLMQGVRRWMKSESRVGNLLEVTRVVETASARLSSGSARDRELLMLKVEGATRGLQNYRLTYEGDPAICGEIDRLISLLNPPETSV